MKYIELMRGYTDQAFILFACFVLLLVVRELWLCATNQCAINNKCVTGCGDNCEVGSTTCETHTMANRGKV